MLSYHADCTFPDFGRKLVRLVHGSIPSRVGASTKLGTVQGAHNDRYTLTLKLFEMAHRQQPIRSLTAMALPLLRDLANATRQSCHLSIYNSGRVAVIAQVDSPERWSFGLKVGAVMGLTDTSSDHVLLAFRDVAERERMLAVHTRVEGENDVEPAVLLALLDEIRATGHEIMPSRQMRGVTNMASPVIGSSGDAIAPRSTCRTSSISIKRSIPSSTKFAGWSVRWPAACPRSWGSAVTTSKANRITFFALGTSV
ncbi:MAG: Transcriptional regulator, IclR family [uncultured Caballeronia sp.]|nr:MAG: Transcriptional regulator, IclR family [uncultured Caballeronia sp.]